MKRAGVIFVAAASRRAIRVSLATPQERQLMKKIFLTLLLAAPLTAVSSLVTVNSADDISNWTGTGTNQSTLVLQWNDAASPASLAWGYRWSGSASGLQMLSAVAGTTIIREPAGGDVIETLSGADPALTLTLERYSFGDAVYSMVYAPGGVTRTQSDWGAGYWEYSIFAGSFEYDVYDSEWTLVGTNYYNVPGSVLYSSVNWLSSPIGASPRMLVNGSWDAWSFAAGFASTSIAQPAAAAVPEPRIAVLLALAAAWFFAKGNYRRAV